MDLHVHIISQAKAKELGMKRYFTGKPCKRGGVGERLASTRQCICHGCVRLRVLNQKRTYWEDPEPARARSRDYIERNKEARASYAREYNARNKQYISEKNREYRAKNRDRLIARSRERHLENREVENSRSKRWKEDNWEYVLEYSTKYYWANREEVNAKARARRALDPTAIRAAAARRRAAAMNRDILPDCELTKLVEVEAKSLCEERRRQTGLDWHVDHMIPLQAANVSGLHHWSNLQVIPAKMNMHKHNKMIYTEPFEWLKDA